MQTTVDMTDPPARPDPNRESPNNENHLTYAGFLSGAHSPDTPNTVDAVDGDSATPQSTDSDSSESVSESNRTTDVAASLRVFSDSMLRMELAELEMIKSREASRLEAEKRRFESDVELTQMILQTQLQIAKFLSSPYTNRKRKRSDEDDSSTSVREGALMLSLLQCNLML